MTSRSRAFFAPRVVLQSTRPYASEGPTELPCAVWPQKKKTLARELSYYILKSSCPRVIKSPSAKVIKPQSTATCEDEHGRHRSEYIRTIRRYIQYMTHRYVDILDIGHIDM